VEHAKRAAEQIDPGGGDRRTDAVVVERERLDEVIQMALVIRDVDDASAAGGLLGNLDPLVDALDFRRIGYSGCLSAR
jgi:hypothetical protein